jgi:TrpR-related protein YerC/YecD
MTRVSRFKLSSEQVDQLSHRLIGAISSLQNKEALFLFFDDLLTRTEKIMLGKRLLIAILLEKGYSYNDISSIVKVSQVTISRMSEQLQRSGKGFRLAIAHLDKKEKVEKWMEPVLNFVSGMAKPLTSKSSTEYWKQKYRQ